MRHFGGAGSGSIRNVASQPSSASASPGTDPGVAVAQSLLARFDGAADGPLGEFARAYARRVTSGPLDEPGIDALAAQVAGLFEFISERRPGDIHARAFNPDGARDGWSCRGSVLEANVDDMPFLIDSVTEELRRRGLAVRNVMHPVIGVERDGNGRLAAVVPARGALHRESVMHFEVDRRMPEAELEQLTSDVIRVIGDVALSVRDFHAMADRVGRMIEFAQVASARYSRDEIAETVAFLEWLTHDNFVFLGYREYAIDGGDDDDALVSVVPDSGLGVLSDESGSTFSMPKRIGELAPNLRERVLGGPLLIVSKTNRESTVHRRVRMDHIGVKRVGPDGSIVGELRMIGLFTSKAYAEPARHIPLVRRKLESIMEQEDLFPGSHDYKAVVAIFESFPKDELFAASEEYLRNDRDGADGDGGAAPDLAVPAQRLPGPQRVRGGRVAPRSRVDGAAHAAGGAARGAVRRRLGRVPPDVRRDGAGAVPLRRPRARARSRTSPARSSRPRYWRRPGRGTTGWPTPFPRSTVRPRAKRWPAATARCFPTTTSPRRRSTWPSSTWPSSRSSDPTAHT